jgi:hypothetical protein
MPKNRVLNFPNFYYYIYLRWAVPTCSYLNQKENRSEKSKGGNKVTSTVLIKYPQLVQSKMLKSHFNSETGPETPSAI